MASHIAVLAKLIREAGLRQSDIAVKMGYKSPSAVGMMLSGQRKLGRKELLKMLEIIGVSLIDLASQSDDLKIAKTEEAVIAAEILDELSKDDRDEAILLLKAIKARAQLLPKRS